MVCGILEVLDSTILLMSSDQANKGHVVPVSNLTSLISYLLILPTATCVQRQVKSVLAALHPTRQSYHNYKDQVLLNHISKSLAGLKQVEDARDLDAEAFYRLVLMTRAIATTRPQNLTKTITHDPSSDTQVKGSENSKELLYQLTDILWKLHAVRPSNIALASVCVPGLTHVEAAAHCIVEIIHAFTLVDSSDSTVSLAVRLYLSLLLCQDTSVSFSAKQAFIRVLRPRLKRRRVYIPSPPHCSTPGAVESEKAGPVSQPSQESSEADQAHFEVDAVEPMVLLAPDAGLFSTIVPLSAKQLARGEPDTARPITPGTYEYGQS
ncbi:hypothetical protein J6590_023495 [Homalodisca vitripennis]|nr:hypothetical protein J6590_023495 [Homalodisca vitripennis]